MDNSARNCLAWIVWSEARGEPLRGKRAVLDVVKARMKASGQSACSVVSSPHQFSGYKKGMKIKVSEKQLTEYREVVSMSPVAANCNYFHNTSVNPHWAKGMKFCIRVGRHLFYKQSKEK